MQHEFGLYGGFAGKYVLKFVEQIRKPIVCVAHTIPIRSDAHKPIAKRNFFLKSAPYIHKYITIMPDGADKLISYGIPEHKVVTIEHGAPDILSYSNKDLRKVLHLPEHNTIIFNFGLLHRRKGIVYAVEAMKYIKEKKLRATLLLITVPLRGAENIAYVEELKKVITSNNLTDYVMIKECYLNKEDLYKYINTADIAILPYIYKSYISSGPLSFFISALKPIITTPFAYASYMLTKESAYFVPYANSFAISKAIEDLILHRDKKTAIISHMKPIRESILWSNQVTKYYAVLKDVTHK
jgi:glycosyltransferase involved in cell wall biosynthesis